MKVSLILAKNIDALLRARGQSQHDLAQWCHHTDTWLSNFLAGSRQIQLKNLDRIADFFGIATYQLLQPGISAVTERRSGLDRRSGRDRRVGHGVRRMVEMRDTLKSYRAITKEEEAGIRQLQRLEQEERRAHPKKGVRRSNTKE